MFDLVALFRGVLMCLRVWCIVVWFGCSSWVLVVVIWFSVGVLLGCCWFIYLVVYICDWFLFIGLFCLFGCFVCVDWLVVDVGCLCFVDVVFECRFWCCCRLVNLFTCWCLCDLDGLCLLFAYLNFELYML